MSNGDIYFTDPPYGLPNQFDDPRRELDFCGVYRLKPNGELTLLTKTIERPNGIGLSPDEKSLYVAQSNPKMANWTKFDVKADGTLGEGKQIHDATQRVVRSLDCQTDLKLIAKAIFGRAVQEEFTCLVLMVNCSGDW